MRRKLLLLFIAAAGTFVAGATVAVIWSPSYQKWRRPPVLELPADHEVIEMRASLVEFQGAFPAVPEFVVPADRVSTILSWLRPAEYERGSTWLRPVDEMGEVIIRTNTGGELHLRFYWTGKGAVAFTPDGKDQFFGRGTNETGGDIDGGINLRAAIKEASEQSRR
jgi:hypothetical protein